MSVEDFQQCYYYAFGVTSYNAVLSARYSRLHLLYVWGLRKLCGMSILKLSVECGFSTGFVISESIALATKYHCIYDDLYNAQFIADYKHLKAVCKPFRKTLSNADYCRKYYLKQQQKKKR